MSVPGSTTLRPKQPNVFVQPRPTGKPRGICWLFRPSGKLWTISPICSLVSSAAPPCWPLRRRPRARLSSELSLRRQVASARACSTVGYHKHGGNRHSGRGDRIPDPLFPCPKSLIPRRRTTRLSACCTARGTAVGTTRQDHWARREVDKCTAASAQLPRFRISGTAVGLALILGRPPRSSDGRPCGRTSHRGISAIRDELGSRHKCAEIAGKICDQWCDVRRQA